MSTFENIFLAIVVATLLFLLFKGVRRMPGAFSKANLSRGFGVLTVIGLALVAFIALLVGLLRG